MAEPGEGRARLLDEMRFRRRRLTPEERERRRFYLLPGMGGRAYHRKLRRFRLIAIAVGLVVSALLALAMWKLNSPRS